MLLQQQPHVNDQVGRHPTMVWDVYVREDGEKIARCLQMTSFGKRGVEGKYDKPHVWATHCQYLPVGHSGTKSRTNQSILELQDGEKMETQSYVHLDHFFEIEACYLVAWGRGRYPVPMGLTSGALDVLVDVVGDFFELLQRNIGKGRFLIRLAEEEEAEDFVTVVGKLLRAVVVRRAFRPAVDHDHPAVLLFLWAEVEAVQVIALDGSDALGGGV